jgi:DNA alkylation repair enzyme
MLGGRKLNLTIIKRKGSRSKKDIPQDILMQLNCGEIESANVVEWSAVDRKKLLENTLKQHNRIHYLKPILEQIDKLKKQTINTVNESIGAELLYQMNNYNDNDFLKILLSCQSDLVRCWGTFIVGKDNTLSLEQMFENIKPFAIDRHFNVREEAWTAVRPAVILSLDKSITILSKWVIDENENIRRFASEVTRPRGVWCKHIEELKQNPVIALPILEPLKSDKSKYVRDSVGNWLNDASKTMPIFVETLCSRWEKESLTNETKYIIKKAMRTINKGKNLC